MRPLKALFTFPSLLCADARAVRDGSQGTPLHAQRGGSLWANKETFPNSLFSPPGLSGARRLTQLTSPGNPHT